MLDEKKSRENYLRVTTCLYPFSGLDKINPEIVAYAGQRGTKVHKICEAIVDGMGEFGVDEETWGYVESFKKWWANEVDVVEMEKRFYDDVLQLTGQLDFIIKTDDGLAIVDIKTSAKESKTWAAQGAAYAYLAKKDGYDIKKIYFLHLNKHGKQPKIYEYPVNDDFFLAIFLTYKYFFYKEPKNEQFKRRDASKT